jgi:hypothetical protein
MVSGERKWSREGGNGLGRGEMVSGGTMAQVTGDRSHVRGNRSGSTSSLVLFIFIYLRLLDDVQANDLLGLCVLFRLVD